MWTFCTIKGSQILAAGSRKPLTDTANKTNDNQPCSTWYRQTVWKGIDIYNFVGTEIAINNFGGLYWQSGYSRIIFLGRLFVSDVLIRVDSDVLMDLERFYSAYQNNLDRNNRYGKPLSVKLIFLISGGWIFIFTADSVFDGLKIHVWHRMDPQGHPCCFEYIFYIINGSNHAKSFQNKSETMIK